MSETCLMLACVPQELYFEPEVMQPSNARAVALYLCSATHEVSPKRASTQRASLCVHRLARQTRLLKAYNGVLRR